MKSPILSFLIGILLLTSQVYSGQYHVTTTGTASGAGTIASPWSIARGIDNVPSPHPVGGDTLWIHGGTYTAAIFDIKISGTSDSRPVVVRNWNNEHVKLVGNSPLEWTCLLRGDYLWVWGLDITNNVVPPQDNGHCVMVGYRSRLINNDINNGQSTGVVSQQTVGTEVYGNIIRYNGRETVAVEGPGYGIYTQNVIANLQRKSFVDNILPYNWAWAFHAYTEGATCDSIWAEGNIMYNTGRFWKITSWAPQFIFTGPAGRNRWFNLRNNYMYLGAELPSGGHYFGLFGGPITQMIATGNFMVAPGGGMAMSFDNDGGSNTVTSNVFVGNVGGLGSYPSNTFYSSWPSTRPDDIFVRPNKYEKGRANIVIFNWDANSTVSVNPNSGGTVLSVGDSYVVKDPLNYWGANVASGTYGGGNITLPMTGLTVEPPLGAATPPHTVPRFAAFIIIGKSNIVPIQLSSFTILRVTAGVRLDWHTVSEVNNYGFWVEKLNNGTYTTIANSFRPGYGTTNVPHDYTYTDSSASGTVTYRLKQQDIDGTIWFSEPVSITLTDVIADAPIPTKYALDQNYPNPFNPSTTITFSLLESGYTTLTVYNVLGVKVATIVNENLSRGQYSYKFDASKLSSGVYVYRIHSGKFIASKKMLLMK